jgi:uncharacterized MAPEG superfamily protein
MKIFAGSVEIQMLCWAVVLGLVQLFVAATVMTHEQGTAYNLSPRDSAGRRPPSVLSGRLDRAFANFKETFVFFAVAVLAVTLLGKTSTTSALGAQIYFWARLVYVPLYAAGIPVVRTLVWMTSIAGLVVLLAALA